MIPIVQNRRIWLSFSTLLVVGSIAALALFGLRLGIDFTGGSLMDVSYSQERPAKEKIADHLKTAGIEGSDIKFAGENRVLLRFGDVSEEVHQKILAELKKDDPSLTEKSFESIGPVIGEELKRKSLLAIGLALAMILLYITYVFRKVSHPVASWKYGLAAILALFHDCLFVLGAFALFGKYFGMELTSAFIPAFLTVLGFSVHDTIVIFDRIRENLIKVKGEFSAIVNQALNQTLSRSVNTSLTVLLVLGALYFMGGDSLKSFSLALILGITIGTYSSIFVASTLLVVWHQRSKQTA